jgi:hypothetical protein
MNLGAIGPSEGRGWPLKANREGRVVAMPFLRKTLETNGFAYLG